MRQRSVRKVLLSLLGVVSCLVVGTAHAQQGSITGRVTDRERQTPIEGARVTLLGTVLIHTTNRDGQYTFPAVPAGDYQVRAINIGYQTQLLPVTVVGGQSVTLDFPMVPAPIQLDQIVVTATGEQRRLEVANAVSTIDAAKVTEDHVVTDLSALISGRAAGVQVLRSSGTTGTGVRLRIRGSNSVSLSNEPLYYVDGVRMESAPASLSLDVGGFGVGVGGGQTSRIADLNPEDIESIEIVKGPAAATLYGIQASNGVVRITTKRGRSGKPRWNFYIEQGAVEDRNNYPDNYWGRDETPVTGPDWDYFCTLQDQLDGSCTQTGIETDSPLEDADTRPLKAGHRQQYGGNVSGGTEQITYFISAEFESEDGVFRLPGAEEDSIRMSFGSVPDHQIRPNAMERVAVRGNFGAAVAPNANVDVNLGYTSSDTRVVINDNSFLTITGSAEASGNPPIFNRGWFFIPAELFATLNQQSIERFVGGLTGTWTPRTWLTTRATVGYDVTHATDVQFFPTGQVADFGTNRDGERTDNRFQMSQLTVDVGVGARYRLSSRVGAKTSVGAQFFRSLQNGVFVTGRGLASGSQTIAGAATTESSEEHVESRSVGSYLEEELNLNERLFLTGALRFDDNSAFGRNFNATVYPKASASWLVSEEPFFGASFINILRLRGAFGVSGQQPGTVDALRFFTPVPGRKNAEAETGVTLGSLGNPDLKPERSHEVELGLDASFFEDRLGLEVSYFTKQTRDALIARDVAPSLGTVETQFFNLGKVRNRGVEVLINARLIDSPSFAWDISLSGSSINNKLIELGEGVAPIEVGFYQRHVEGLPLGGFWSRELISFEDANNDGIIDNTEYVVGNQRVFVGNALPTKEASLNTTLGFFGGSVRLSTQFDYRGGHVVDNSIESFRCQFALGCRGLVDRTASLREQALAQAALNEGTTEFGYFEPGWFVKMRELSLTLTAPDSWTRAFRASRVSLTLAARNLLTIDDYTGVDPEVNAFGQDNFSTSDFETQPQVRYLVARLNVGF